MRGLAGNLIVIVGLAALVLLLGFALIATFDRIIGCEHLHRAIVARCR